VIRLLKRVVSFGSSRETEGERTCHPIHGDIGYVKEVAEHVTSE